jgi:uncharacterized protein (UPF0147 family)
MRATHHSKDDFPDTFLPRNVARAADAAMENVLFEDDVRRMLRAAGVPEKRYRRPR